MSLSSPRNDHMMMHCRLPRRSSNVIQLRQRRSWVCWQMQRWPRRSARRLMQAVSSHLSGGRLGRAAAHRGALSSVAFYIVLHLSLGCFVMLVYTLADESARHCICRRLEAVGLDAAYLETDQGELGRGTGAVPALVDGSDDSDFEPDAKRRRAAAAVQRGSRALHAGGGGTNVVRSSSGGGSGKRRKAAAVRKPALGRVKRCSNKQVGSEVCLHL